MTSSKKYLNFYFILTLALILLSSFLPINSYAKWQPGDGEFIQTGKPCNNDITKDERDLGGETFCFYCPSFGSEFVNIKWDLTNRGGIGEATPYCFVRCSGRNCTGGDLKDGAGFLGRRSFLEGSPQPNLDIVDEVKIRRPPTDARYWVTCCPREDHLGVPMCGLGERVTSKKFFILSECGFGGCLKEPETLVLRQPTWFGRLLTSFPIGARKIFYIGQNPVACVEKIIDLPCRYTIKRFGPAGEFLGDATVSTASDVANIIQEHAGIGATDMFLINLGCNIGKVFVDLAETTVLRSSI